ncbi:MAG: hypothetical protein JWM82_2968, partial [Myxococcales bacterium]|nr:hypothetical protein [Myxococcales bacterium]
MEKITLRRIGWVGASLGLTSVLVGCNDMPSDAGAAGTDDSVATTSAAQGYLDTANGLNGING